MDVSEIPQFVRNAGRFREVVAILAKHGLADWISTKSPEWLRHLQQREGETGPAECTTEQRIRIALAELGTTYIKLGQVLSTRPDLVGQKLADELAQLREDAPADKPETARAMIESELGRPVDELFASFEPTPMASASIGQVHQATTRSGRHVVVKVQHPGIEPRIVNDLEILTKLAELAEQQSEYLRQFRPIQTVREFQRTMMQELDFGREQRNLERFRENFKDDPSVRFPEPHPDLCSRRILTMELLEGIGVNKKEELDASGLDLAAIARRGADLFLAMIFRDGFYHADPHPGNLMVLTDRNPVALEEEVAAPETRIIGVLDCGMVGRLDDALRDDLERVLIAVGRQDSAAIAEIVSRIGEVPADVDDAALRSAIQDFVEEYTHQSLDAFDLSGCLKAMIEIIRQHRIVLPTKVVMLLKTLIVLEGTARQLNPTFNLAELIRPYAQKAVSRRYAPKQLINRLRRTYGDWDDLIRRLPRDLADILRGVKSGKFEVHLEHRRLEPIVNRLVLGILTAALFIGSTSLCDYQVPPVIRGISLPGLLGCLVSITMGWLLIRAIRRRRE